MGKSRTTPEAAAASFGLGHIQRHFFICTGPDCAPSDEAELTWKYVKQRMKELGLTGPDGSVYRTRVGCFRICTAGPIAVVYPEGAWYQGVTPDRAERIIQEHIIGGHVVEKYCFARNPLFPPGEDPE
jgi:(2Fe-2S) ferredoxin